MNPQSGTRPAPKHVQNSIFDDFQNFDFCQKLAFGYFEGSQDIRGLWQFDFFWFLVDFVFFYFSVFLGGRKILAGGYGAVLVGVSMM